MTNMMFIVYQIDCHSNIFVIIDIHYNLFFNQKQCLFI